MLSAAQYVSAIFSARDLRQRRPIDPGCGDPGDSLGTEHSLLLGAESHLRNTMKRVNDPSEEWTGGVVRWKQVGTAPVLGGYLIMDSPLRPHEINGRAAESGSVGHPRKPSQCLPFSAGQVIDIEPRQADEVLGQF